MNIKFKKIFFLVVITAIHPVFNFNSNDQSYQEYSLPLKRQKTLKSNINKAIEEQKNKISDALRDMSLELTNRQTIIEEAEDIIMAFNRIKDQLSL